MGDQHESDSGTPQLSFASPPDPMTEPCSRFFERHVDFWDLIAYMGEQWEGPAVQLARTILKSGETLRETPSESVRDLKERATSLLRLLARYDLTRQLVYCGVVDNYLAYISELLSLIFRTKPETLKSGEQERLDEILRYSSMDELVLALAEKRVQSLSYQGMKELSRDMSQRLGFELFTSQEQFERVTLIIEIRNLIVHKRGVIDRRFLLHCPGFRGAVGEQIEFGGKGSLDRLLDAEIVAASATDIDQRASRHFGLPRPVTLDAFNQKTAKRPRKVAVGQDAKRGRVH